MTSEEIKHLAKQFLRTYNYLAKDVDPHAIVFSRPTGLGVTDEILVYIHRRGAEAELESELRSLARRFERVPAGPGGRRFFLAPEPLGVAPPVVSEFGFTYQVPAFFFDREFTSLKPTTTLKQLERDAARFDQERIDQPFRTDGHAGADLLAHLLSELRTPLEPSLRIVVAPAGYGKTVLIAGLYSKLKEEFTRNKNQQKMGMRPLLMLPGHLGRAADLSTLVNNFIGEEYDFGMLSEEGFSFWVRNNFGVWLLDGLEELILKSPEEFMLELLNDYIAAPNTGNPQIVVAVRKPILATSPELKSIIDDYKDYGVRVYELVDWSETQAEAYFRKNLRISGAETEDFLREFRRSVTLRDICRVPYYCRLVADLRNDGKMRAFADGYDLVSHAVSQICEREFTKNLDPDVFPVTTQMELLAELAGQQMRGHRITRELLTDHAEVILSGCPEEVKLSQTEAMRQHALLTGASSGSDSELEFTQDIIKQYLEGMYLAGELARIRVDALHLQEMETGSLTLEFLRKHTSDLDWAAVMSHACTLCSSRNDEGIGFRNAVKVLLSSGAPDKAAFLRDEMQEKNLTGIEFRGLALSSVRFCGSKLDGAVFADCDLAGCNFDGCLFRNTAFDGRIELTGATTKGALFEVIRVDGKVIGDKKAIERWFYDKTKVKPEHIEPCQAAVNTRRVLEKVFRKGRGGKLPMQFLLRTRCEGVSADRCVKALVKAGYLRETGDWVKPATMRFAEITCFVERDSATEGLRTVLDGLCDEPGCIHVRSRC